MLSDYQCISKLIWISTQNNGFIMIFAYMHIIVLCSYLPTHCPFLFPPSSPTGFLNWMKCIDILNHILDFFILYMRVFCQYVCMYVCMPVARGSQNRAWDSTGTGLQMIVNGQLNPGPLQEQPVLLLNQPSPQLWCFKIQTFFYFQDRVSL